MFSRACGTSEYWAYLLWDLRALAYARCGCWVFPPVWWGVSVVDIVGVGVLQCDVAKQDCESSRMARSNPRLTTMSSYHCFRDGCGQDFGSQRAWSQHIHKAHKDNLGTSRLTQIISGHQDRKRKRAEEEEVQRAAKRRALEVPQEELVPPEPAVCPQPCTICTGAKYVIG